MVDKKWVLMILIIDYKKNSSKCKACEVQLPDVAKTKLSELYATTFLNDCTLKKKGYKSREQKYVFTIN